MCVRCELLLCSSSKLEECSCQSSWILQQLSFRNSTTHIEIWRYPPGMPSVMGWVRRSFRCFNKLQVVPPKGRTDDVHLFQSDRPVLVDRFLPWLDPSSCCNAIGTAVNLQCSSRCSYRTVPTVRWIDLLWLYVPSVILHLAPPNGCTGNEHCSKKKVIVRSLLFGTRAVS